MLCLPLPRGWSWNRLTWRTHGRLSLHREKAAEETLIFPLIFPRSRNLDLPRMMEENKLKRKRRRKKGEDDSGRGREKDWNLPRFQRPFFGSITRNFHKAGTEKLRIFVTPTGKGRHTVNSQLNFKGNPSTRSYSKSQKM